MRMSNYLTLVAGIFATGTVVGLIVARSAPVVARAQGIALASTQPSAWPSSDRSMLARP